MQCCYTDVCDELKGQKYSAMATNIDINAELLIRESDSDGSLCEEVVEGFQEMILILKFNC